MYGMLPFHDLIQTNRLYLEPSHKNVLYVYITKLLQRGINIMDDFYLGWNKYIDFSDLKLHHNDIYKLIFEKYPYDFVEAEQNIYCIRNIRIQNIHDINYMILNYFQK